MRRHSILTFLCLFQIFELPLAQGDTLYFQERDIPLQELKRLQGHLKAIDQGILHWQHPHIQEIVKIDTKGIHAIHTDAKGDPPNRDSFLKVTMVNNDALYGKIITLTEKTLLLKTPTGRELTLHRNKVARISHPHLITRKIYAGPKNAQEWFLQKSSVEEKQKGITRGDWIYHEGSLQFKSKKTSSKSIPKVPYYDPQTNYALKKIFPQKSFILAFDYSSESALFLRIDLGACPLVITSPAEEKKFPAEIKNHRIRFGVVYDHQKAQTVRFEIYYDHPKHLIYVYANGKKIYTYEDLYKEVLASRPRPKQTVTFSGKLGNSFTLKNIHVYPWNGKKLSTSPQLTQQKQDQVLLNSNRHLKGQITTIDKGQLIFTSQEEKITVPMDQIREICFGNLDKTSISSPTKTTCVSFTDQTRLTMDLQQLDETEIRGQVDYSDEEIILKTEHLQEILFTDTPQKKTEPTHILYLKNGDQLTGKIQSMQNQKMQWRGAPLLHPVTILTQHLESLHIISPKTVQEDYTTYINLLNGDILPGEIHKLEKASVTLHTAYGGEMHINRHLIKDIVFKEKEAPLLSYEGYYGRRDWSIPTIEDRRGHGNLSHYWNFQKGSIFADSTGLLTNKIALPNRTAIEFSIDWNPSMSFHLLLFGDKKGENLLNQDNFYELTLRCHPITNNDVEIELKRGASRLEPQMRLSPRFTRKGRRDFHAKVSFYIDKKKQAIALVINDKFIHQWSDSSKKFPWSNLFGFKTTQSFIQSAGIRYIDFIHLHDFKVSHWDGVLPTFDRKGGTRVEDTLFLENGDKIKGKVLKIGEKTLSFGITNLPDPIALPRDTILKMTLAKNAGKKPKKSKETAKITFHNGACLTMDIEEITHNKLKGSSQHFEEKTFDLSILRKIQFDLTDKKK